MDKTIKAQWIAALRSDEYEQGVGKLRNADNKFCCLGVLCDVVDPSGWDRTDESDDWEYGGFAGDLPTEMNDATGITPAQENTLTKMNDGKRASFAEIADYIEREL